MIEKVELEDTKEDELLSKEREINATTKSTQEKLVALMKGIENVHLEETSESDLYADVYEGVDVEGNINPHVYYHEFIDYENQEKIDLSPTIKSVSTINELMPIVSDSLEGDQMLVIGANRCEPSKKFIPELNKFASSQQKNSLLKISYLETDQVPGTVEYLRGTLHAPELADSYPTIIVLNKGSISNSLVGGYDARSLQKLINTP